MIFEITVSETINEIDRDKEREMCFIVVPKKKKILVQARCRYVRVGKFFDIERC